MPLRTGRPNHVRNFNSKEAWRGPFYGLFDFRNRTAHGRCGPVNMSSRDTQVAEAWRDGVRTTLQVQAHIIRRSGSLAFVSEEAVSVAIRRLKKKLGFFVDND